MTNTLGMNKEISIEQIIRGQVQEDTWNYLSGAAAKVRQEKGPATLYKTFAFIPRKTGSETVHSTGHRSTEGLTFKDWSIDRLCRVWLLMQLDSADRQAYVRIIEDLFAGATMNELIALYSALPVLAYPQDWKLRCAEGIRSNIGGVLEAIMYENEFPFQYLELPAWNQMVLKAIFTEKNIGRITGIDQRANRALAEVLFDFAHERWAAGRSLPPQIWRLTAPFLDAVNFPDIQRLINRGTPADRNAALLACSLSPYGPAIELLDAYPAIKARIDRGEITWDNLLPDAEQAPVNV